MYYTLFLFLSPLIIPALLSAFCFLRQTLSAPHFLHHSAYFCLTHPLSNSVTSPYVSHLSPPHSCQMPMIHIRSVYTSCCSSLSSHPDTLTSPSRFPRLFRLCFSLSPLFLYSPHFFFFSHCFPPLVPLR